MDDQTQVDPNAAQEEQDQNALQAELDAEREKLVAEQELVAQEAAAVRALDAQVNNDPTVHRSFAR